jgi:hypothetical protein
MKNVILRSICLILLGSTIGCSVFMAANQPDAKDIDLFKPGTNRELILGEFGTPMHSETNGDGQLEEIYKFTQGYSGGAKAGRALFHGAADVFTLGLWEIVGTPIEGANDGDELSFKVTYDESKTIVSVTPLNEEAKEEMGLAQKPKDQETDCDPGMESCD